MAQNNILNYQGGDEASFGNLYQGIQQTLYRSQDKIAKQQKAEQDRIAGVQKELQSSFSKINRNGLQQVDIKDYDRLYEDVKNSYAKVITSKYSPNASMEFEQKKNELLNLVANSKERGQRDYTANQQVLNNITKYKDGEVKKAMDIRNATPTLKLTSANPDYTSYIINYDATKLTKDLEADIKTTMDSIAPTIKSNKVRLGGRDYAIDSTTTRQINDELALSIADKLYKGNANAKRTIDEVYGGDVMAFVDDNKSMFSKVDVSRTVKADPIIKVSVNGGNGSTIGGFDVTQGKLFTYGDDFNGTASPIKSALNLPLNGQKVTLNDASGYIDMRTGEPLVFSDNGLQEGEVVELATFPFGNVKVLDKKTGKYVNKKGVPLTDNIAKKTGNVTYEDRAIVKVKQDDGEFTYALAKPDAIRANVSKATKKIINDYTTTSNSLKPKSNSVPSQPKGSNVKASEATLEFFKKK